jgi:large subunit ribosomal protein L11
MEKGTAAKETVASIVKKELGIQTAKISEEEKTAGKTSVGDISMEKIVSIAKNRKDNLLAKDFKSAVKQVIGSINSMSVILIEGKKPKEIIQEINEGKWDSLIK